jgi:hypothetical protein
MFRTTRRWHTRPRRVSRANRGSPGRAWRARSPWPAHPTLLQSCGGGYLERTFDRGAFDCAPSIRMACKSRSRPVAKRDLLVLFVQDGQVRCFRDSAIDPALLVGLVFHSGPFKSLSVSAISRSMRPEPFAFSAIQLKVCL